MSQYATIAKVIAYITEEGHTSDSLEALAKAVGMSKSHLQKTFTAWVGITPKQFGRYLKLQYAKELLTEKHTMLETSTKAGLSSGGRLHDLFVDIEAMTPGEYQNGGRALTIAYSIFETKFGICLVASTERGICNVLFADSPPSALEDLKSRWTAAHIVQRHQQSHEVIEKYLTGMKVPSKVKLHLRGTNFQIKVWEALLSIPEGNIATYGDIGRVLGDAHLGRAVGTAVGNNPVGYIIPCHRVLKSSGAVGGYRWGVMRKRAMLSFEALMKHGE